MPLRKDYQMKAVNLPYLSGWKLRLVTSIVKGPLKGLLVPSLLKNAGVSALRQCHIEDEPVYQPQFPKDDNSEVVPFDLAQLPSLLTGIKGEPYPSVNDYAQAYRSGETTPSKVALRLIELIEQSNGDQHQVNAVTKYIREEILSQAEASTQRYAAGEPLSLFDGVPVLVKDELDMNGFATTLGTRFLNEIKMRDATVVARFRKAGALLVGKANMHEIGLGVTGLNVNYGVARNPHDLKCHTGGSSSGSAAAVAAGLVPVAIGADGGGSIRIPSALCGVVGIKSTYGRISCHGAGPLDWSVGHVGPIAASVEDCVLAYGVMAGEDAGDENTLGQPAVDLQQWNDTNLSGLKIGIYRPWFEHADPQIVSICEQSLEQFKSMGAELVDVRIPFLEEGRIAHAVTIVSEMMEALSPSEQHHNQFGYDVQLNFAIASNFSSKDYVTAQRVRARLIHVFEKVLQDVDVIATPATAITAPKINPAAIKEGESDLTTLTELMRFAVANNFTGHPAIAFPVGYSDNNLPIGMQMIGRGWEEKRLFQLAWCADQFVKRHLPDLYLNPLKHQS